MRPSEKLLRKIENSIPGLSHILDPRNFNLSWKEEAAVELVSSLILDSEKNKGKKASRRQFSKRTKEKILISQKCRCKLCGTRLELADFDHIDGNPSNNAISNCQALCPNCHAKKTRMKG